MTMFLVCSCIISIFVCIFCLTVFNIERFLVKCLKLCDTRERRVNEMTQPDFLLASYIDHTLLKADATKHQIQQLCKEALKYQFATVCVNSTWLSFGALSVLAVIEMRCG